MRSNHRVEKGAANRASHPNVSHRYLSFPGTLILGTIRKFGGIEP